MVDHVCGVLVDPCHSLDLLVEAAQKGDESLVQARAEEFNRHAYEMMKVDYTQQQQQLANITCLISGHSYCVSGCKHGLCNVS